jgi:hypothetical protein
VGLALSCLNDVTLLDTIVAPLPRFAGKTVYRAPVRPTAGGVVLAVATGFAGCFALAAIIQAVGGSAATSSVIAGAFYWLLFLGAPIGYVVWKNWQGRARDVRFTVAGLPGEPGGPIGAVRMSATEDSDDVRATVNALVTMVL